RQSVISIILSGTFRYFRKRCIYWSPPSSSVFLPPPFLLWGFTVLIFPRPWRRISLDVMSEGYHAPLRRCHPETHCHPEALEGWFSDVRYGISAWDTFEPRSRT